MKNEKSNVYKDPNLSTMSGPGVNEPKEQLIPVNGRQQIIDMLRHADHDFREHILKNLEKRDPRLAQSLRNEL